MSEASPERVRRARERGSVAVSQRLSACVSLGCALTVAGLTVRTLHDGYTHGLRLAARAAATDAFPNVAQVVGHALTDALRAMAPVLAVSLVALALTHALQSRFLVTWPEEEDDPSFASPIETTVTVVWIVALGVTACVAGWSLARETGVAAHTVRDVTAMFPTLLVGVAWRVLAVATAMGVGEFFWRRARYLDALRPTRDEELRELREERGDQRVRDERERRRELSA